MKNLYNIQYGAGLFWEQFKAPYLALEEARSIWKTFQVPVLLTRAPSRYVYNIHSIVHFVHYVNTDQYLSMANILCEGTIRFCSC